MTITTTTTRVFHGSFIVRNSLGAIIEKGEIYSRNGVFPEHALLRVAARYGKKCIVKFLPNIHCTEVR